MWGKYKIVALCMSRIGDSNSFDFVSGLGKALAKNGYRLFVYNCCSDLYWNSPEEKGEAEIFNLVDFNIADALIIFDDKLKNKRVVNSLISRAKASNTPIISVSGDNNDCININFDTEKGFESVVTHVMEEHKPTSVHFIAGMRNNLFSQIRIDTFKRIVEKYSFKFDDSMISYGDFWSEPTKAAVKKLIEENRLPQALICANDSMAIAACGVLDDYGYKVPEDVIVTGFDGIDETKFSNPKITTSLCSYKMLGEMTSDIIKKCFDGEPCCDSYQISPQLLLSESCGCHTDDSINVSEYVSSLNNRFYRYREEERSLNEMNSRILRCSSFEEAAKNIDVGLLYDMCCLLRRECTDRTIDPMSRNVQTDSERLYLFFDTDHLSDPPRDSFPAKDIIPGLPTIIEREFPLIFTALNFMDIPLGYVCFYFKNYGIDNYGKISQTVNTLNNSIGGFRIMRHQQYMTQQFELFSQLDFMTGLYNRSGATKLFDRMKPEAQKDSGEFTFILADLDGLKYINDNFGHTEGDNAIITIASAIKAACPPNAVCARIGGDEIIAFFAEKRTPESIKSSVKNYIEANARKPYEISASIGVYSPESGSALDFEMLVKASDKLMYREKINKKSHRRSERK